MGKLLKISDVTKILGIHEQTIRNYERKHLIKLKRDNQNFRCFNKEDILRISVIIKLTQELGFNISGVKLVFSLSKKLNMSDDELIDFLEDHLNEFQG
jgi:MerR family transcriptional regulator/heat shock protein HspR